MSDITIDQDCACLLDITTQRCLSCRDGTGNFTCHGCCQPFCPEHAHDHRTALASNLQQLIVDNQRLDVSVGGGDRKRKCDRARGDLARWEENAIATIRRAAEEVRRKLATFCDESVVDERSQLIMCRNRFTWRLNDAQAKDNYHERQLIYWRKFLHDLNENFARLRGDSLRLKRCGSLIEKMCITEDATKIRFAKWCEYKEKCLKITDVRRTGEYRYGNCTQPIVIKSCESAETVSDPIHSDRPGAHVIIIDSFYQGDLHPGEYRFRLSDECRFIGIISKERSTAKSMTLSSPSVYGWSTVDAAVHRDGVYELGMNNDLRPGDTLVLNVPVDHSKIELKNLTRPGTHVLNVCPKACPVPWRIKTDFA